MPLTKEQIAEMKKLQAMPEDARSAEDVARIAELQAILDKPEPSAPAPSKVKKYTAAEFAASGIVENTKVVKTTEVFGFIEMKPGSKAIAIVLDSKGTERELKLELLPTTKGIANATAAGVKFEADAIGRELLEEGDVLELTTKPEGMVTRGINGDTSVWVQLEADPRISAHRRRKSRMARMVSEFLADQASARRVKALAATVAAITEINQELDANKVFGSLLIAQQKAAAAALSEE